MAKTFKDYTISKEKILSIIGFNVDSWNEKKANVMNALLKNKD